MRRRAAAFPCFVLAILSGCAATGRVLADGPSSTMDVWPGKAPGEAGTIGDEHFLPQKSGEKEVQRLTNITHPTLTIHRPARDRDTGASVIIAPGGGYHILAWDLEGEEIASWLNSIGVTGIVLKYRVPRREGTPNDRPPAQALMDAQRAVSLVRSKAGGLGIDPKRIGILGFSAGGHLSAWTATHFDERTYPAVDEADKVSCRPDFAVLVYPAYLDRQDDPANPVSHVGSTTPPMFLAHAADDSVTCKSSLNMFQALRAAKVPAELHIYSTGGHGFGLRASEDPCSTWPKRCEDWMRRSGLLKPPGR
ncbi:alpha/beta hydrolase [Aquisphaera insulae]|uniref:alpha/beta hydrolase n=1 Tax=Aquisphaera insulae TaxID=2712864 RepID=UPI0013ED1895|nr:alpha/beta hydrolase [Aquisphaera insulae]